MDRLYRGIETSLLAFTLLLGLGALALSGGVLDGRAAGRGGPIMAAAPLAVTLPMITVTAIR